MEQYPSAFEKLVIYCRSRVLEHAGIMHPGKDSKRHRAINRLPTRHQAPTTTHPPITIGGASNTVPDNKFP
jgi:hypothetical protein